MDGRGHIDIGGRLGWNSKARQGGEVMRPRCLCVTKMNETRFIVTSNETWLWRILWYELLI